MSSQMHNHLREYVENGIQQKVRLNNKIIAYQAQETKTKERIIDQTSLQKELESEGAVESKIEWIVDRTKMDEEAIQRVRSVLENSNIELEDLTFRMKAHLEEMSEIEILSGGFVTHPIGLDKNVIFDSDQSTIKFEAGGHIEIPIAVKLNQWKDSSQLTIKKIKKVSV